MVRQYIRNKTCYVKLRQTTGEEARAALQAAVDRCLQDNIRRLEILFAPPDAGGVQSALAEVVGTRPPFGTLLRNRTGMVLHFFENRNAA